HDRLYHLAGRQAQFDPGSGSAGALRARHADLSGVGGRRANRQPRTGRRRYGSADRCERQDQRRHRVRCQAERPLDLGASCVGSPPFPSAGRIDLFKQLVGLDLTKMYPAGAPPDKELADKWTWDAFLTAAEKCSKAGHAFGLPLGVTNDSVAWVDPVFRSNGAALVDQEGNITVKSDATKQVLEWFKRLVPLLPRDAFAWDDASNNKFLISGEGALIFNPPSAWAVAVRDAPKVAEQVWHFPTPKGPKGQFEAAVPFFWGVWKFSPNKSVAKSLLTYLCQRSAVEQTVAASHGY